MQTNYLTRLERHIEASPSIPPVQQWQIGLASLLLIAGIMTYFAPGGLMTGFFTLQSYSLPFPDVLWEYITFSGDKWPMLALGLTMSVRHPRFTLAMLLAGTIGLLLTQGCKLYFHTARPPALLPLESFRLIGTALTTNSTPSGHTATAFLAAGLATHLCRSWVARTAILAIAAIIGYSRIAVGVHWPVDVMTGAAAGLFASWIGVLLAHKLQTRLNSLLLAAIIVMLVGSALKLLTYNGGFANTDLFAVSIAAACLGVFYSELRRAKLLPFC